MRTEKRPLSYETGEAISPPRTGYNSQGLQILTDLAVDPAGDVWFANDWDLLNEGLQEDS